MRRTFLRAIALVGAVTGLGLVVAHAGMTVGCNHGTTPESQAPVLSNAAAPSDGTAATATATAPATATTTTAGPSKAGGPSKAKDRMRYLPATKAAPVFWPNDVTDDPLVPPPQAAPQQNAAPQRNAVPPQQNPKGGL
jgi:hypothetical protein